MTATETEIDQDDLSTIAERMERMEGEVAELRHTVTELAQIVVGDIKDRRESAMAFSAPLSEISIPTSLVPGGQTTADAVKALRKPWLLIELLRDCGATLRMYMDPRYRVRRSTKLMVPLIVGALLANYFVFNLLFLYVPVLTEVMERIVTIVLAVLLYKVLIREVTYYRQVLAQMAWTSRAWKNVPPALLNNDPDLSAVRRTETP